MPSPRPSRSRVAAPAQTPPSFHHSATISTHGSQITILWVLMLLLSLGCALVLLSFSSRIGDLERDLAVESQLVMNLNSRVGQLAAQRVVPVLAPSTTSSMMALPPSGSMTTGTKSPSGALDRGTLSPDGTKYAGYNDTVKGKIGLAVETLEGGRVRYIQILNPKTESTGMGTAMESELSVRWTDNQTIQYDVLVMKNGQQTKETRTTNIFF